MAHTLPLMAHNDSTALAKAPLYGGTQVKLDIASPIIIAASNKWQMQHYEMAVNVRLKDRFYPTFELGYAGGTTTQGDTIAYAGQGGFFRAGVDLHPLKKHPESPHALLIGIRLGAAVQDFNQDLTREPKSTATDALVATDVYAVNTTGIYGDCWGEIVAGCQVEIAKVGKPKANSQQPMSFYMGWMGRLKCLFTRSLVPTAKKQLTDEQLMAGNVLTPIYIPGYGKRDNIAWGFDYYLGWRF